MYFNLLYVQQILVPMLQMYVTSNTNENTQLFEWKSCI